MKCSRRGFDGYGGVRYGIRYPDEDTCHGQRSDELCRLGFVSIGMNAELRTCLLDVLLVFTP